jgi:predicted nuclease of predicted toxin-antitoxin system
VRWLIDECVDAGLAALLSESGHDVVYMSDVAPRAADPEVMNRADRENRLLLTEDKDFGDLVFRQARPVPGLVLVRIDPARRSRKGPRLLTAIDRFGDALFGHYTVIEDARFRSRPLRSSKNSQ